MNAASLLQADVSEWKPEQPVDIIYSNAALHWVDHHELVFPRLRSYLGPGGVLAIQVCFLLSLTHDSDCCEFLSIQVLAFTLVFAAYGRYRDFWGWGRGARWDPIGSLVRV